MSSHPLVQAALRGVVAPEDLEVRHLIAPDCRPVGRRVAALDKARGRGGQVLVDTKGVAEVPDGRTAAEGETVLVAHGSALTRDDTGSERRPVPEVLARTSIWNNTLPRGRRARFPTNWAGCRPREDRARRHTDLAEVFAALRRGVAAARVAARLPLARAAEALRLAEPGTVTGKVVLSP
ncbi:zinc-binding dehydrogenase [Streptomyces sp. MMS24-I2-30]|uniref:zinc-binding dehydrogenase n=1 Tax=Streptomyces sp. MMS24-I2-30 TaxID=3351564 RepID=UPI003896C1F3